MSIPYRHKVHSSLNQVLVVAERLWPYQREWSPDPVLCCSDAFPFFSIRSSWSWRDIGTGGVCSLARQRWGFGRLDGWTRLEGVGGVALPGELFGFAPKWENDEEIHLNMRGKIRKHARTLLWRQQEPLDLVLLETFFISELLLFSRDTFY